MLKKTPLYQITLLILGVLFFILNYYTPFQHDDYAYAFNYDENSAIVRPTNIPISGIFDIFTSQYWHYICVNGRFFTHIIVQLFCGLFGKAIFNIISSIVFICGIHLIVKYINCNNVNKSIIAIIIFSCLISFIPDFGQTFLWLSGSVNYMWASFATLFIIMIFNRTLSLQKDRSKYYPILFISGLFLCWMQESISIGLGCVTFLYLIRYKRHKLNKSTIILILGIVLGTALLIFTPANFMRIGNEEVISKDLTIIQLFFVRILNIIFFIHNQKVVLLLIIILCCLRLFKRKIYQSIFNENRILILTILFDIIFIFALGKPDARIGVGISLFSMILILKILSNYSIYINKHLKCLIVFVFILKGTNSYINAVEETHRYYNYKIGEITKLINAPNEAIIKNIDLDKTGKYIYYNCFSPDKYNFHNKPRAVYYGKTYMQSIPTEIYSRYINNDILHETTCLNYISNDTISATNIYSLPDNSYWIIPIDSKFDNPTNKKLKIIGYNDNINTTLTSKQKILNTLFGFTYNQPEVATGFILTLNNHSYLIFPALQSTTKIELQLNTTDSTYNICFQKQFEYNEKNIDNNSGI